MITSTVLAVFFVPVFYMAVQSFIEYWSGPPKSEHGMPHLSFSAPAGSTAPHVAVAGEGVAIAPPPEPPHDTGTAGKVTP